MSPRQALRRLADRTFGTAFDRALARARPDPRRDFVFAWNQGLGDIALGLVPFFQRVRAARSDARIVVVTRADLREGFLLAGADAIVVAPGLERGDAFDLRAAAPGLGIDLARAALVLGDPDPDRWIHASRQNHPPALHWRAEWDARADPFIDPADDRVWIGVHAHSETAQYYGYRKDWPASAWPELFERIAARERVRFVLFGHRADPPLEGAAVLDLRGRTSLIDLLAIVKRRCRCLVAPDSGVLTTVYYLDAAFDLTVVSLWSDPRQGILKQRCPSPNPRLVHVPLVGRDRSVETVSVDEVGATLQAALHGPVPAAC